MGIEPGDVFDAAGLSLNSVANPDNALSFTQLDRLLTCAVQMSGCPHLGVLVGRESSLAMLGLVGELMRHAPTVRQALRDLADNQHRYVRGAVVYFAEQGGFGTVGYAVYYPGFVAAEVLTDGAMAAGLRFCLELGAGSPSDILVPRPAPLSIRAYVKAFGAPIRFGCEEAAFVFRSSQLDRPVPGADPARRAALEDAVRGHWETSEPTMAHMARRALRSVVLSGSAELEIVAARLGVHPRTLNRRLKDEGMTFRSILNDVRFDVACQLLEGTGLPITQIALWLGYSESASFAHAFKRWAGMSAVEWRSAAPRNRNLASSGHPVLPPLRVPKTQPGPEFVGKA